MEWSKMKKWNENRMLLQNALDEVMSQMLGRSLSYKKEIVDENGRFSVEKLEKLLDKMMSIWEDEVQKHTDIDATDYIEERKELYRSYLYMVMRCSLINLGNREAAPNFEFVLAQAKKLSEDWCVLVGGGNTLGEPAQGHFGLHAYSPLNGFGEDFGEELYLEPGMRCGISDDGASKRIRMMTLPVQYFKQTPDGREPDQEALEELRKLTRSKKADAESAEATGAAETAEATGAVEPAESAEAALEWDLETMRDADDVCEPEDNLGEEEDYEPDEFDFDYESFPDVYLTQDYNAVEPGSYTPWELESEYLPQIFFDSKDKKTYNAAYCAFTRLFREARLAVMKDFYQEIEQIVDWYLLSEDLSPLSDGGKMLNICKNIQSYPLREAKTYVKGIEWERIKR